MDRICIKCGLAWDTSILTKDGRVGYICPRCTDLRNYKQSNKPDPVKQAIEPLREIGTKGRRKRDAKRKKNADRYM